MSSLKALFLTEGPEVLASSRTRAYAYLPYLVQHGVQCDIRPKHSATALKPGWGLGKFVERRLAGLKMLGPMLSASGYDVVFVQKLIVPLWMQELIRRRNENLVFDFDDVIYVHGPQIEGNWALGLRARFSDNVMIERFNHMLSICKAVIVQNCHTREYVSNHNPNVAIITTPIDTGRYRPRPARPPRDRIVVGWIGSPFNTAYLESLRGVLQSLSRRYPQLRVDVIGSAPLEWEGVQLEVRRWALDTEVANMHRFDIGLMPLPENEWTRGKGGYKLLQYMAIGIPSVASPVGINAELIQDGVNGFLAKTAEEWEKRLVQLIEDEPLRKKMGKAGRRLVVEKYSLKVCAPRLLALLREVAGKVGEGPR